jgi:hypothetical protein
MCGDYYDEDIEGNRFMRLQVSDKEMLSKAPVGTRAEFRVAGEIVEVEAPRKVRNYDIDWDRKKGFKAPTKEMPGHIKLKLDKPDPDLQIINEMLMAEETGATD